MPKVIVVWLWYLLIPVAALIFLLLVLSNYQVTDLPDPPAVTSSKADDCIVSSEAAEVHKKYENALIQFVNDDNTVQVHTIDTKLAILFEVKPEKLICFRKGSITPVTIAECVENSDGECDFSLPHTVYVRTGLVNILNWKYTKPAS